MDRQVSLAFQTDKTPAQYIALAQLVDPYGFDGVSVYCDAPYQPSFGPLLLMAPHLKRARLGPAAVSPFRIHPIDIAAEIALLAGLAPGRVYLGLARGAWLKEHGISEPAQPIAALREAITIIRNLLEGRPAAGQGRFYQIAAHVRAPYPLPAERIPLLIGTWGRSLAALSGELADEVKVGGSANPDFAPRLRTYIQQGERAAGRTPGTVKLVMGAICVVDEDRQAARQAARRAAALYLPVVAPLDPTVAIEPDMLERLCILVEQEQIDQAARLISDDLLDRFGFSGAPGDIIEQAEALFAAGVDRIEFGTPHGLSTETGLRLLGEKVLPALKP